MGPECVEGLSGVYKGHPSKGPYEGTMEVTKW